MKSARVEAFSDGVIAIIITIMVLELPRPEGHDWHALHAIWPAVLSYALSFVYVGIYWNNHHHMFQVVEKVNGRSLWANLFFLFWLSLFPYVTGWAGESHFAAVPMACYAAIAFMCAVAYSVLTWTLQRCDLSNHVLREATGTGFKEKVSMAAYVVAVVAPAAGRPGVIVCGACLIAVAAGWLIPDRRIERVVMRDRPGGAPEG